ncbi:MAG TPA: sporulation protein [Actinomycetota bacterium]|nr:sporulation protein [Actinomycetota bacterium]
MPDLDAVLTGHRDAITVRRIYGDPVESDGVTVIPAASVFGGSGGGGDMDGNGGGGFGLIGRPAGAWVIKDGEVTWQRAIDLNRLASLGFLLLAGWLFRRRRTRRG